MLRAAIALIAAGLAGGAGLVFKNRRLHRALFIPPAPSRAMDVAGWEAAPRRDALRVLFVGHSLINEEMPAMVEAILGDLGVAFRYDVQLVDGGSLQVNWQRPPRARGVDARAALRSGEYDTLVLTEAVNLDDMLMWMEPSRYAALFFDLAVAHRPDIRLHFYEGWHDRESARWLVGFPALRRWDQLADADLAKWEHIVDRARGDRFVAIVPGGQALSRLTREVEAGRVPGLDSVERLFSDGVHLTPLGNYFIALVQAASLARVSPVGALRVVPARDGDTLEVPESTARRLQELAWEVVRGYPRSGVLTPAG